MPPWRKCPTATWSARSSPTRIKLLRDQTNRGDIKLINKSFKELRYALKIFAPYRDFRKVSIFGSARTPEHHDDYQQAARFGKIMADAGWMVITGAGGGIMAAGHGGAGEDPSFGLAIRLPFEQKTNPFIEGDPKLINFKYFFTRKLMFVRSSHAIALFPRRIRHDGRRIRSAHARADRQERAHADRLHRSPRLELLGQPGRTTSNNHLLKPAA